MTDRGLLDDPEVRLLMAAADDWAESHLSSEELDATTRPQLYGAVLCSWRTGA